MPEAFIYDHVRTPRGRGKADGSLHEVTALALATVPLKALKERNNLGEDVVDDVVLGVVDPVGEAGSDIARFAALKAGLGEAVPGVQISRFCASGLDAVNFAAKLEKHNKQEGTRAVTDVTTYRLAEGQGYVPSGPREQRPGRPVGGVAEAVDLVILAI